MLRLVVLDVEGVLTLPGGGQYPWPVDDLLRVRQYLEAAALPGVLCTGRQQPYGEAIIQALNLFSPLTSDQQAAVVRRGGPELLAWPSVMENGAYFYDPVAKRPFPHPELTAERREVLQHLRAEVLWPLAQEVGAVVEAGKDFSVSLNPPPRCPGSSERQSTAEFAPVVEAALGAFAEQVEVKASVSAIDITPRGISKASAVRLLLRWMGLAPAAVLGVGDTRADELWLQEVGWRAAPANGRDALPGMHYYAESEVAAGLLEILQHAQRRGWGEGGRE
jgi:hydroxymethylpyrimidine pyrophosphatase-like HAD family hydrolase